MAKETVQTVETHEEALESGFVGTAHVGGERDVRPGAKTGLAGAVVNSDDAPLTPSGGTTGPGAEDPSAKKDKEDAKK